MSCTSRLATKSANEILLKKLCICLTQVIPQIMSQTNATALAITSALAVSGINRLVDRINYIGDPNVCAGLELADNRHQAPLRSPPTPTGATEKITALGTTSEMDCRSEISDKRHRPYLAHATPGLTSPSQHSALLVVSRIVPLFRHLQMEGEH